MANKFNKQTFYSIINKHVNQWLILNDSRNIKIPNAGEEDGTEKVQREENFISIMRKFYFTLNVSSFSQRKVSTLGKLSIF